jgi:hypothetical protein
VTTMPAAPVETRRVLVLAVAALAAAVLAELTGHRSLALSAAAISAALLVSESTLVQRQAQRARSRIRERLLFREDPKLLTFAVVAILAPTAVGIALGAFAGVGASLAGDLLLGAQRVADVAANPIGNAFAEVGAVAGRELGVTLDPAGAALLGLVAVGFAWLVIGYLIEAFGQVLSIPRLLARRTAAKAEQFARRYHAGTPLAGVRNGDVLRVVIHELDDDEKPSGVTRTVEGPVTHLGRFGPGFYIGESYIDNSPYELRSVFVLGRNGQPLPLTEAPDQNPDREESRSA